MGTWRYAYSFPPTLPLLASTGSTYSLSVGDIVGQDKAGTKANETDFFKQIHWSPDGSCILSASNDESIRLFHLPPSTLNGRSYSSGYESFCLRPGEAIQDISWYPHMYYQDRSTCCFLTSVRDRPIQLWDVWTGQLRASYTPMSPMEHIVTPLAISFNPEGSRIYGCAEGAIYQFDIHRPGQTGKRCPTTPTRKDPSGQKGILSCMGWNPDGSGVYAVGSYNGTVGFYTDESPGPIDILSMGEGRRHGLTQVTFSPCGRYLYTTCRRGGTISCWDVRATGECLWQGDRQGDTNQRLGFSLSSDGRLLSAGDLEGNVFLWKDILEVTEEGNSDPSPYSFKAHQDAVSAAQIHPYSPLLATASGQRHYEDPWTDSEEEDELERTNPSSVSHDNSLKLWSLPGQWCRADG
ncbi:MAG: WD40-repeat-containing domain protein [Piptocephalis tieghemiana]|nr:MAG: WD40-repeat-containing domain protein [Piptocephalis tieghemiana]